MSPARWQQLKQLYAELDELPPEQRCAYLDQACAGDAELRAQVEALLAHQEQGRAEDFLEQPIARLPEPFPLPTESGPDLRPGQLEGRRFGSQVIPRVGGRGERYRVLISDQVREPIGTDCTLASVAAEIQSNASTDSVIRTHRFFWYALMLGTGLLALYCYAVWMIIRLGDSAKTPGWSALPTPYSWVVNRVDTTLLPRRSLQTGDRILSINGDPRAERVGAAIYMRFIWPGSLYTVGVLRGTDEFSWQLRMPPLQRADKLPKAFTYLLLSLSFYIMGMMIGLLRPQASLARLGFTAGLALALRYMAGSLGTYRGIGEGLEFRLNELIWLCDPWHLALSYHFVYRFSSEVLPERFWSTLKHLMYTACAIMWVVNTVFVTVSLRGREYLVRLAYQHGWFTRLYYHFFGEWWDYFQLLTAVSIGAVMMVSYHRMTEADQRCRVRWVVFGSVAGLAPLVTYLLFGLVWSSFSNKPEPQGAEWSALGIIVEAFLIAIPATLAYAVIRYRILGINVAIRRSLQYLLAQKVLQAIMLMPLLGLLLPIIRNPNQTLTQLLVQNSIYLNGISLIALSLGLRYRQDLRVWLDRKFFREAYRQERILQQISGKLKECDSLSQIATVIGTEIEATLHPEFLHVFCRETEQPELILHRSSPGTGVELQVLENLRLGKVLRNHNVPQDLPLPHNHDGRTSTALLVPVTDSEDRLAGLVLLGEKKSQEAYTPDNRNLLQGISNQVALVLENIKLRRQLDQEHQLRQEVLGHLDAQRINLLRECEFCGKCFDAAAEKCSDDRHELTRSVPVERIIANKYRLEQRLGKGGMGIVYEATDLGLHRKVALKVMTGHLFGNQAALRRFEREARTAAALTHANIVAVHEFGRLGGEGAYLVMERAYGLTWRNELKRRVRLDLTTAADWLEQLLAGLRAAHEMGIVHRDLKPENILITPCKAGSVCVKILDFGVAKFRSNERPEQTNLTEPGMILGTLGYMSPEQLTGQEAGERSDIFSVGVITFESITGQLPFRGNTPNEILAAIDHFKVDLDGFGCANPSGLEASLQKCLARDPEQRFSSVAEMQCELLTCLRDATG